MASAIPMPKLGNTVESTILIGWRKTVGESIAIGETLCDVETDKAAMEVESPVAGTVLALLYNAGDEIPVMVNIAVVGTTGEDISQLIPKPASGIPNPLAPISSPTTVISQISQPTAVTNGQAVSPRARNLAARKQIDLRGLQGSGPNGRIIERDVQAAHTTAARLTPVAQSMVNAGDYHPPERGTGAGGRITKRDLIPTASTPPDTGVEVIPLKGARKIIAARMLESLQTTAQLTMNTSADARALQAYRQRLKASPADMGLQSVTLNDLLLFAVSRTLPRFPDLNSLFIADAIHRHAAVHLGMAVDTDRGLLVPVIRNASTRSLKSLADEAHRLAAASTEGRITPDEMTGGTFTVTNLGSLGIESFTPVLNPPQVAILGVGSIQLKPVDVDGTVNFIPHIGLSLTVNHQVVDGAPAARFLQALAQNLAAIDLLLGL
ncbi:MAG: 2-oxo acid dehydrogenase subunit E2 [Chloroflexi bacterium]|nr:2-oxo acid dehydrogenase subunit E2 [Chloroflexota bacterium]MCC6896280.1 2-oxo acid dehydrogenase subunit E2 [Anaerolineae bacterium]